MKYKTLVYFGIQGSRGGTRTFSPEPSKYLTVEAEGETHEAVVQDAKRQFHERYPGEPVRWVDVRGFVDTTKE